MGQHGFRQPEKWRRHKIISATWLLGIAACYGVNAYYDNQAQQNMQQVSADVKHYRTQHSGACLAKLADTGTQVRESMDAAKYFKDEKSNECMLIYKVYSMPYDYYRYNFTTKQWDYAPD